MYSMAVWLGTGRVPGCPRQMGQTFEFGGAPNSFLHPQNIFVTVASSTWHSNPTTVSKSCALTTLNDTGSPDSVRHCFASSELTLLSFDACAQGSNVAFRDPK